MNFLKICANLSNKLVTLDKAQNSNKTLKINKKKNFEKPTIKWFFLIKVIENMKNIFLF